MSCHFSGHVRQNCGFQSPRLKRGHPLDHGLVEPAPHLYITLAESFDLRRRENHASLLREPGPVGRGREITVIIGQTAAVVQRTELIWSEMKETRHLLHGFRGGLKAEDLAVVKDYGPYIQRGMVRIKHCVSF